MEIDYAADASMFDDDTAGTAPDGTAPESTTDGSIPELEARQRELAMETLAEWRDAIIEKYPALENLAEFIVGQDYESMEQFAYELNQRVGGEVVEGHPGANTEERLVSGLSGNDVLGKALSYAKETGKTSALMALKRAHAYEQAGLSGSRLDNEQREDIRTALRFARGAGDHAAVMRLQAQLG